MAQATIIGCITSKTINLLTSPLMIGRERKKGRLQRHKPPSGIAETDPNRL